MIGVFQCILLVNANRLNNICQLVAVARTQAWTPGVQTDFSFLSGLTFLRNVYVLKILRYRLRDFFEVSVH